MMDLTSVAIDLQRTGYAEILQEQYSTRPAYHEYYEPQINILMSEYITISGEESIRYLTIEEQEVFDKALRRSVRILHKGGNIEQASL